MTANGATDFDIATLRARRTNKWHKFPADVLPAWVADMDFGVAPSIAAAMSRLTENQEYGYAAREGALADAFVRRMERRFGWHTDPADTLRDRRSGAGQFLLGHGVQRTGRRDSVATSVLSAIHARHRGYRPPPDRQPDARRRHALGCWTSPRTRRPRIRGCAC